MENMPKVAPRQATGSVARVLAVLGFIAILAIGMWGSVQIASAVPGAVSGLASAIVSLTSIFVPASETVIVSASSSNVVSGNSVTFSWTHTKKSVEGSYTLRYDCADGVYFTSLSETDVPQTVYCNVPFNFVNTDDSVTVTAISEKNRFIDVTVYIDFTPNGVSKAIVTGKVALTITNENVGSSPTVTAPPTIPTPEKPITQTPAPTPISQTPGLKTTQTYPVATTTAGTVSNPNGYIDLTARIIEVGVVDKVTGDFTASSTPSRSQRIAVRFAVENIGTKTSNQFMFNAVLPTLPYHIFSSPTQKELGPNDRIEFTVGFDSFDPAKPDGEFIVNVDPANSQNEKNETNNIVKYVITTTP